MPIKSRMKAPVIPVHAKVYYFKQQSSSYKIKTLILKNRTSFAWHPGGLTKYVPHASDLFFSRIPPADNYIQHRTQTKAVTLW